ncbi:MAG: tetratricopeptide repeat protein [Cyanobacteria bacterium CRU_2_1]|nr:tetratricopeptide repeat protein [Cyanobacteria bacterium RU_5_0]NJR61900.1 tetratricopeptide repeat protein [Cyanobacteria bacterium CRU_2_1]
MNAWRIGWSYLLGVGLFVSPIVSTLSLLTSPVLAQAVPSSVREAYRLLGEGLVNQAIALFEETVQQYPRSIEARLGLAIAYRRAGRDADAFATYEQVLAIDSNNRLALLAIGVLGGYRAEWQTRGIAALDTLLTLDPGDTDARTQRALLYSYQGRFGEAIEDYELILQTNPILEAIVGAAQVYAYVGEYQRSLDLFSRYQTGGGQIEGGAAIAYALALRETGNPALAVQILQAEQRRQTSLTPLAIQTRASLAVAYAANGQITEASTLLTPLRGRQDSRMILARALNDIGRYTGDPVFTQEAIALYQEVLRSPQLTVGLAREIADTLSSYPSEQQYALEIYRQLLQQQPNDRVVSAQIAILERQLGLISDTDLRVRLDANLVPLPSDRFQQRIIAQSLARLDSPDPALQPLYQSLIDAGVNEPLLYFRIAQIQIETNQFAEARETLVLYSATPEGMREPYATMLLLAEIDRREGNLDASAQRYLAVINANPSDIGILTGAYQGLAGIRQTQGQLNEAIALYDQIIALNPQDPAKRLGRASLAYQAGIISQAEAEAVLNNWLATRPPTDTPPELFSLAAVLPPSPDREVLYTNLLTIEPDNPAIQLRLVQVIALRDPGEAQALVNQLIARNPNNVGAYFVQGQLEQDLGNLDDASDAYETILSLEPNNADALLALGGVRFQQQRYQSASQLYNEVLDLQPQNPIAQSALANLSVVQGRRLEAIEQLEQLQLQQIASGAEPNEDLSRQIQLIEEGFLQQRGFQVPWERY